MPVSSALRDQIARLQRGGGGAAADVAAAAGDNVDTDETTNGKRKREVWSAAEANALAALLPTYWAALQRDRPKALGQLAEAMLKNEDDQTPTPIGSNNLCRRRITPALIDSKIFNEVYALENGYVT